MVEVAHAAPARASLSVTARPGLESVPRAEWDGLVGPGQAALQYGFVAAWARVALPGLQMRPLVARRCDDDALVAAAPGCLYDLDPTCLKSDAPPLPVRMLRRLHQRLMVLRIYEVGITAALVGPWLTAASLGSRDAARALLPEALREARRSGAHLTVVQDFPADGGDFTDVLTGLGFIPVPVLPTVVLELPFASFDEYLERMRAPYRRRAQRVLTQSAHLRVERREDFASLAPELARLARATYDRATEIRREILTEAYFRAASAVPELSLLVLRREDDTVACFGLLMDDGRDLHFLNCGFDTSTGRDDGAYFRLLYEIVRAGIEAGHDRVNFGVTTVAPKLDVGGVPVAMVAWIRFDRDVIQWLCKRIAPRVMQAQAVTARRVFKDPRPGHCAPAGADVRRSAA